MLDGHFFRVIPARSRERAAKRDLQEKILRGVTKKIRRPQLTFFGLHTESAWSQPTWRLKIENCVLFFYVNVR